MNRIAVESSNIAAVGYDPATQQLEVEFKSGGVYRYEGVTAEQHKAFIEAPSLGKHFQTEIRNKFPSSKVEQEAAA